MRQELPSGTVTFLFTDIEGATRLLHALGPDAYADALGEHRRMLREAFAAQGGVEVDTLAGVEEGWQLDIWDAVASALGEEDQTVP